MIIAIRYNWFHTVKGEEKFSEYVVGYDGVEGMYLGIPTLSERYIRVKFEDGHTEEVYNINMIISD